MNRVILNLFFFLPFFSAAQEIRLFQTNSAASFRGISSPGNKVCWISGTGGTVCLTTDGGQTVNCVKVNGYDSADFRSLYAFDDNSAIICGIGSPGYLLKTMDRGKNWEKVYSNDNPGIFIDGIDFWNEMEGIAFGDPLDGKLFVIKTTDGGKTWRELPGASRPSLTEGEASFAASGTTIRCYGSSRVIIATGGSASRLFVSDDKGNSWKVLAPPVIQGEPSRGIFSFDFFNDSRGIVVGGDYKIDSLQSDHVLYTLDGGSSWLFPEQPTRGYRECVTFLSRNLAVALGPSGIDYSIDGGIHWLAFSEQKGLHAMRKTRDGNRIFICGSKGLFGWINVK